MTNAQIQARTLATFNQNPGLRLGDFVRRKDGTLRRIAVCDPRRCKGVQTTTKECPEGNFYLERGMADSSGSRDFYPIDFANFRLTKETREGTFWHFNGGVVAAGNRLNYTLPCRVYEEI